MDSVDFITTDGQSGVCCLLNIYSIMWPQSAVNL